MTACRARRVNLEMIRVSKSVDILIQTTQRYTDLWERMEHARGGQAIGNESPQNLYTRFWSLQREQYRYWCLGFIDDVDFRLWMQYRYEESKYCKPIAGITYLDGAKNALVFKGDIDYAMSLKSKHRLA